MVKLIPKSYNSSKVKLKGMGGVLLKNSVCLHDCVPNLGFDRLLKIHVKTRIIHAL